MKKILLILSLFTFSLGFAQMEEPKIFWSEDRPLTWGDFQGPPNERVHFHASTSSGIGFSWSMKSSSEGTDFQYEITNSFNPDRSWVKGGKQNEHLLVHEQLHFDISELHARKFRKAVAQYEITDRIKQDLNRLYKETEQARQRMQQKFDAETRHSQNEEAQKQWENYVRTELEGLKEYAL